MADLIFVILTIFFFVVGWAFVKACDRL